MTHVKPIPDGRDSLIPYLVLRDAAKAIDFYKQLFGAQELMRMTYPGTNKIAHAEIQIRNAVMMLGEEAPQYGAVSPLALNGPSPVNVFLYVPDVDAIFNKAVSMGAKGNMPPGDMFWGDRYCKFTDPFGHNWAVATHIKDVPPEEMAKLAEAAFSEKSDCGKPSA